MKIIVFWGDLTDVATKNEALLAASQEWAQVEVVL